jgi:hypothetical protein
MSSRLHLLVALALLVLLGLVAVSAGRVSVARATTTSINDHTTGTGTNQFDFHGTWTQETDTSGVGAYNNDDTYSDTTNDYYLVRFTGVSITLYDVLNWGGGQGSAQICNSSGTGCGSSTTFDDYSATRTGNQQVYASGTLTYGSYSLKVTVTGVNGASGHAYLAPDRVAVDDGSGGSATPLIGAIRWDGWWQDNSGVTNPYLASPEFTDYDYRQPVYGWFDNRVANQQTLMNQEIDDAAANHLDFWAFDWYPPSIDTCASPCLSYDHPDYYANSEALYKSSPEKSRLKFADLVQTWWLASGSPTDPTSVGYQYQSTWVPDLVSDFQDPQYVKVNGNHPLLFWFGTNQLASSGSGWGSQSNAQTQLNYLINATTSAGLGTPYIVDVQEDAGGASTYGFQGVSGYDTASFGVTGHQCYSTLSSRDTSELSTGTSQGLTQIPALTSMSDPRPRDADPSGRYNYGFWYDQPTFGEWLKDVHDMWTWADGSSRVTTPPVMLTYAWNEIDEGGPGLEPTIQNGDRYLKAISDVMTNNYPASYTDQLNDDNCNVSYSGTWSRAFPLHGSTIATSPYENDEEQSSTASSSAQVSWPNTTGFTIVGSKGPNRGKAEVYVDTTDEGTIDTYASSLSYDQTLYSITGLTAGTHTVKIVALGTHSASSSGSLVGVDTFNATIADPYSPPSGTVVNDNTTGTGTNQFDYHGTWTHETDTSDVGAYNNDDTYSHTTNDYYLVRFTGTSISLYDVLNPGGGQGTAQICNSSGTGCGAATTIDDYASVRSGTQQVYSSGTLTSGSYSLKVTVSGTNGSGGSAYIAPDRVVIN